MKSARKAAARFALTPPTSKPRSTLDRSHRILTAFDSGYLVPVFLDDILPGDTVNIKLTGSALMMTPLVPLMDYATIDFHWFFVPNRLTWENWHHFLGEKDNPSDSTEYMIPWVTAGAGGFSQESLADFLGVPPAKQRNPSALPFRAYNLIWKEYYRAQFLQDSPPINKGDGPDDKADYTLRRRGKHHDYFTSANPWPIYGDDVNLPLSSVPIAVDPAGDGIPHFYHSGSSSGSHKLTGGSADQFTRWNFIGAGGTVDMGWDDPKLEVDLSQATSVSVNELREATALQRLGEQFARGGARLPEIIKSTFGVESDDARLQRPEFLGGHSQPINFIPVPQTSETSTTEQGNLAAYGQSKGTGSAVVRSFNEHGYLICLASIRADQSYSQGMPRHFFKVAKEELYWPELAHLGEQEILNGELFVQGNSADYLTFGYQGRYDEYRYMPNRITGKMRTQATGTLRHWHLGQHYSSLPVLGDTFIQENAPFDRASAVIDEPEFKVDLYCEYRHTRVMPVYNIPGQGGRL